jgi:hypothetical protein
LGAALCYKEEIFLIKEKIDEIIKIKSNFQNQYQFALQKEVKNEHGVMNDSLLTVRVIEAVDLVPQDLGGTSDPYCILECGDNFIETSVKLKTLNPRWDESFSFPIISGNEVLRITVLDQDNGKDDDYEGEIEINVRELYDQKSVNHWFDLKPSDNSATWKGKLNLNLWWVHSKVDMLKSLIAENNQEVEVLEETIEYYNQMLKIIESVLTGEKITHSPIDNNMHTVSFNDTTKLDRSSKVLNDFDHLTLAKLVGKVYDNEQKWALTFESTSNKLSYKLGFDQTPWYLLFQAFMYVYIVLTFLC